MSFVFFDVFGRKFMFKMFIVKCFAFNLVCLYSFHVQYNAYNKEHDRHVFLHPSTISHDPHRTIILTNVLDGNYPATILRESLSDRSTVIRLDR